MRISALIAMWIASLGCGETVVKSTEPATIEPIVTAPIQHEPPPVAGGLVKPAVAPERGEQKWIGRVEVPGAPALVIGLEYDADIENAAKLAIPSQRLAPTPLLDVSITAASMAFTLPIAGTQDGAKFSATRSDDTGVATGTLVQGGVTMPLTLRRLAPGETLADAMRPQTPKPPFPYVEREASYESKDGTTLAGTLSIPNAPGKHAAIVLISGTGEQDRDATLSDHKLFAVIADHLTRAGIAVLRVDDRGVGGSRGSTANTGFDGKIEDVVAAMTWLAAQPEIDRTRIGLLGHSEGGILAPLVAVRAVPPAIPVAFVVLLAAPGVPGTVLLATQMDETLRAQRVSPERLAIGNAGQKRALDAVVAGADDAALKVILTEQIDALIELTPANKPTWLQRISMIENAMLQVASPAMRDFIRSDPGPALEKLACPVLALGGTRDLQVPGEANIAAIRAALARGNNPDVTAELVPGHNHLMQPATLGTTDEWASIDITIDPAVLGTIAGWLRARVRR